MVFIEVALCTLSLRLSAGYVTAVEAEGVRFPRSCETGGNAGEGELSPSRTGFLTGRDQSLSVGRTISRRSRQAQIYGAIKSKFVSPDEVKMGGFVVTRDDSNKKHSPNTRVRWPKPYVASGTPCLK